MGKDTKNPRCPTQEDRSNTRIHGDILDKIISHIPLIHLASPSLVSKSWKRAVSSSLLYSNKPKPWLFIHTQSTRPPFKTSSSYLAYDPRTPNRWINISKTLSHSDSSSTVRSSHSSLLYTLSPTKLSISTDPLHLAWSHLPPPSTWRTDPIVAVVGRHVIVAGGACNFDVNPAPMEVFDPERKTWEECNSMPDQLRDIACSQWVSVSVQNEKLYMTEKMSGTIFCFDPERKTWVGPVAVRADPEVYFCVTGFVKERFLMVGLVGEAENVRGVRVYQVGLEGECVLLSEMSEECLGMLKGEDEEFVWSVEVCFVGSLVYVCNGGVVVVGEWCGQMWKWWWVKNEGVGGRSLVQRMVFSVGDVGLEDLQRALNSGGCHFELM